MIRRFKDYLKRFWPPLRLRAILFLTLLFVAALPGISAVFLRVYENTLVQQTEAELIAQAAVLSGAYRAVLGEGGGSGHRGPKPQRPTIDLNEMPILPEQPAPLRPVAAPDPAAARAAGALRPIVADASLTTLAATRILDPRGTVVLGREDTGLSYRHLPEVRAAMAGRTATVLRRRGGYSARYWLEFLSRASAVRVHYVRPIAAGGKVIGILMLSRSPRGLFLGIYQDRGKIALGVAGIFLTLLVLAGLLSRGIARPIEALSEATESVARGGSQIPEPPATAAVEIRALYANFAAMAERIDRRSRYLRDFAASVSHELKTPISGIRGALELLQEHRAEMSDAERQRFLANAAADADRMSHLLSRLMHLARADMAVPSEDAATPVEPPLRRVADAHTAVRIKVDIPGGLPEAAVPAEVMEAVLETLLENSRQAGASSVAIRAREEAGGSLLTVADDGPGIAASDHERVFEPFHTGRRSEGGSGLGLSIARSLLASSRATIASRPAERGALFEVRLPARSA